MTLTSSDYINIASSIEVGRGSIEYKKGSETIYFDYSYDVDGYIEDDYINGTGAFIRTSSSLCIENVESYNDKGYETTNDFCESELEKIVE